MEEERKNRVLEYIENEVAAIEASATSATTPPSNQPQGSLQLEELQTFFNMLHMKEQEVPLAGAGLQASRRASGQAKSVKLVRRTHSFEECEFNET